MLSFDMYMCVQCNLHGAWWIYLLGQVIGALLASLVSTPIRLYFSGDHLLGTGDVIAGALHCLVEKPC